MPSGLPFTTTDSREHEAIDLGDDPPIAREFGWHRRPVQVALAVILVVTLAALWGGQNPGNYLYVDRFLDHPVAAAFIVVAASIVLVDWLVRARWIRYPVIALLVLVECLILFAALLWYGFGGASTGTTWTEVASPDGRVVAQMRMYPQFVDPNYRVVLQTGSGITRRENTVADSGEVLPEIEFRDEATVVITRGNTDYIVEFDPETLNVQATDCVEAPVVSDYGEYTYDCPVP